MESIEKELKGITVDALRKRLQNYGEEIGPITNTTKFLFVKKLATKIFEERYPDYVRTDDRDENSDQTLPSLKAGTAVSVSPKQGVGGQENVAHTYYGICLPLDLQDDPNLKGSQLVFTDKVAALKAVKSFKGSRFKAFKNRPEAEQFCTSKAEQIFSPLKPAGSEYGQVPSTESIAFKAPKMPELTCLRKLIEKGDEDSVRETVWSNPRYLISSGDTPVILQEGFRYNALHVAAKNNQPQMCRLIIETIQNPGFMKTMYPMDSEMTCNNRIKFITDLYLNMPDKGFCESPLHFACKFGFVDVVEVFASHPSTDRKLVNRHGETPSQVVCARCSNPTKGNRERIQSLLEDSCFVPLLRSEDNCSQPVIGEPWSPDLDQPTAPIPPVTSQTPRDPQLVVRAYAGPMSPSMADTFHRRWTTPPSGSPDHVKRRLSEIRREDCDKGIERIGRKLAHDLNVPWAEYWQFLKAYIDLRSGQGLNLLNTHLRGQYSELFPEESAIDEGRLLEKNLKNSSLCELDADSPNILDCADDSVFESYNPVGESEGQTRLDISQRKRGSRSSSSSSGSSESNYSSCVSGSESDDDVYHNTSETRDPGISAVGRHQEAASWPNIPAQGGAVSARAPGQCAPTQHLEGTPQPATPDAFTKYRTTAQSLTDLDSSPGKSVSRVASSETSSDLHLPCPGHGRTQTLDRLALSPASVDTLVSSLAEDMESKLTISWALTDSNSNDNESFARLAAQQNTGGPSDLSYGSSETGGPQIQGSSSWGNVQRSASGNQPEKMITDADEKGILRQSKFTSLPGESLVSNSLRKSNNNHVADSSTLSDGSHLTGLSSGSQGSRLTGPSLGAQGSVAPGPSVVSHGNSPPGTPRTPQQPHCHGSLRTPKQHLPPQVFIQGTEASKLDLDVLRAIEDLPIDPQQYPYIHRWKKLVTSFDEETRQSWPTPAPIRSRAVVTDSTHRASSPALSLNTHSPAASPVSSHSADHTHQRLPLSRLNLLSQLERSSDQHYSE